MIRWIHGLLCAVCLIFQFPLHARADQTDKAQERRELIESLTKKITRGETIELKALEIQAKIYEPNVLYILDRAHLEINFEEERVEFTPRILDPIMENRF